MSPVCGIFFTIFYFFNLCISFKVKTLYQALRKVLKGLEITSPHSYFQELPSTPHPGRRIFSLYIQTRSYNTLRGLTSSSCGGGLWPTLRLFFQAKRAFHAVFERKNVRFSLSCHFRRLVLDHSSPVHNI